MKKLLIAILLFGTCYAEAQNSSADELAQEQAKKYLAEKMFKQQDYQPGVFYKLEEVSNRTNNHYWALKHECQTIGYWKEGGMVDHTLLIYFDRHMNVLEAIDSHVQDNDEVRQHR